MESMPPPLPISKERIPVDSGYVSAAKDENSTDNFTKTLEGTVNRIARSLPREELHIVIREAIDCEAALLHEIRVLEQAAGLPLSALPNNCMDMDMEMNVKSDESVPKSTISSVLPNEYNPHQHSPRNYLSNADDILATVFAPHDRYFTLSALLGRLREPLTTPPPPSLIQKKLVHQRRISSSTTQPGEGNAYSKADDRLNPLIAKHQMILELQINRLYTQLYTLDRIQPLITLWKRISNHRTALVFRKPVNPEEAPGYKEKIQFPMDLSLIRKLITNGYILSFQQLHEYLGLICHNCIKFNGRESDYAGLAREFEAYVDESMLDTLQKLGAAVAITTTSTSSKKEEL